MSDPAAQADVPAMSDADAAVVAARWKRNAALFLSGQTVSLFGSMLVQYAVMWYVTFETRSGLAVALYAVCAFLPQGIVSIFGGTLADRMNRRVLVIVSDSSIAIVTLALALLMMNGVTDLWIILLAVAVRSVGAGFQTPAVQAMIPQIVPPEQLLRVNGIFGTIQSAMALLAPAAAGAIFAAYGLVPLFFVDAITAAIGIAFLLSVAVPTLASIADKTSTYREDLVEGIRYIGGDPVVRWLLVVFAFVFLLTVAPTIITPLLVARTYGTEVWMVAVLEIAFSVGMLGGGALVSTLFAKSDRMTLILVSCFGFAVFTAGLGLSPDLWVFYGFTFAIGLFVPLFSAPFMTLVQETVAPEMHGRVFSYVGIVMALATPIGAVAFGPLADVLSVQTLLVAAGIITVVVITVAISLPSGRAAIRLARAKRSEADAEDADAGPGAGPGATPIDPARGAPGS